MDDDSTNGVAVAQNGGGEHHHPYPQVDRSFSAVRTSLFRPESDLQGAKVRDIKRANRTMRNFAFIVFLSVVIE
jgi:hypothetical protein